MNYLKLFLVALSLLFFAVKPASAETIPASSVNVCYSVSGLNHVEYIYIDDKLYEITYSDDGRVLQVQPAEE